MIRQELVDEIIENTRGTCHSLDYHLDGFDMDIDDLSMEELAYIDDEIFVCDCCGWWCELSEICPEIEDSTVCVGCEEDWE